MTYEKAKDILTKNDQLHVLRFWDKLSDSSKDALLKQIEELDFNSINKTKALLNGDKGGVANKGEITPAPVVELKGEWHDAAYRSGTLELISGKVAALVVAGGQGSRLGYEGPKGCYSIGPISEESLFYFHARKIVALQKEFNAVIPFYIMTSQANNKATVEFFEKNDYFGLKKEDVFFFVQSMWPALDADGKIVLDAQDHIFMSPDGHGGTLSALEKSGALADMEKRGIKSVYYFQVDNPMVDVCDPAFIGFHVRNISDLTIKVCAKRDPNEGLGVVVMRDGKSEIVEYTEFTPEQKNQRGPDGELYYKYGSVAIHVFSVDFLVKEAKAGLPIHVAHKKVPYVNDDGVVVKPDAPNAYKFEKFIFDALLDAENTLNCAFDRTEEFSPVKNADGSNSPATCKADLSRKWARWLQQVGVAVPFNSDGYPLHKIEIDPCFAHNPASLRKALEDGGIKVDPNGDILLKCDK